MEKKQFNHGEAFSWMYYSNDDGTIGYHIYNSRDGVTPFMCRIDGIELQHRHWNKDLQQPNYKPAPSDLVWRTMTEDEAEKNLLEMYEFHKDNEDFQKHPAFQDKDKAIADARKDARESQHPILAIVDETGNYIQYKDNQ